MRLIIALCILFLGIFATECPRATINLTFDQKTYDEDSTYRLFGAAASGNLNCVKQALAAPAPGPDPQVRALTNGFTLYHVAAAGDFGHVVAHLLTALDGKLDPMATGSASAVTPLHVAAWRVPSSRVASVYVQDTQLELNAVDLYHQTALLLAADGGNEPFVRVLADAGPDRLDVDLADASGATPLVRAASHGDLDSLEITRTLLNTLHANPNVGSESALSPLTAAVHTGRESVVKELLSYEGTDVNFASGPNKFTALLQAAYDRKDHIISTLMSYNADPCVEDTSANIAAQYYSSNKALHNYSVDCTRHSSTSAIYSGLATVGILAVTFVGCSVWQIVAIVADKRKMALMAEAPDESDF